ncbi:marine proteobacterial sortase target protein [Aliiglaciecola sp. LCG003]|uniref:marine proteobacterial sortase target protein n=1 Tax=Aliiglaciecola sp. LCG003 TaxID=3053655 RepID=UPI00257321AE|nr:marine proteobacterial sortase target protein [Aliiglaciecola sp. LCG003]WJG09155.1 marine proteobacterial sortase target protein [Aliiglaciecola sp. LCG003]
MLLLLLLIGALQYAMPLLLNNENKAQDSSQSKLNINLSYEAFNGHTAQQSLPNVYVENYQHVEQGSMFLQKEGQAGYLLSPLLDTRVDINISGLVARATVTQVFTNTSDDWVNGIYVFPLPENAAVDHLQMQIGERTIVGQIHPNKKAKEIYKQAKREGKKASLLEQQRPNLFKNSVANIGPGESIQVTIEYQQGVQYQGGTFSLRFPTTITERYLPSNETASDGAEIGHSGWALTQPSYKSPSTTGVANEDHIERLNKVSIDVRLNPGFELEQIDSEFHPIHTAEKGQGRYEISLQQDMIANQDFVLSWQPSPSQLPRAAHFIQQGEDGFYGMVMMMPPDVDAQDTSIAREVIFVIDTSGSMSGESMQQAKQALYYAVEHLPETDSFNLVQFDSTASKMWNSANFASTENKKRALTYINALSADGGTEMLAALQLALGNQPEQTERIRQVIFITDGSVGNENQLFEYIHANLQKSRLFTVGIGSAPNSFFMTEAARMGKGTFSYIGSIDNVQQNMQQLFSKLTHPVLADLSMNFSTNVEVYPSNLPDLYKGEPVMVSYKSALPLDNLKLTGSLKHQFWQKSLSLQQSANQRGLDVLWARRKIAQLGRDRVFGGEAEAINQQIEHLAMAHHLVSEMTSLVAVDVTPTALDISQDTTVKSHRPKGQLHAVGSLPQTATSAQLQWMLGLLLLSMGICTVIFTKSH